MRKLTTEEFIARARAIHGDKYDYSMVVYINATTKVCIICPEHGEFWQRPNDHINNKNGCPYCYRAPKAKYLPIGISVPKGAVAIPLPRGKYALVDEDDADRVMQYNWSLTSYGYAYNSHKIGFMHRFIMNTPSDMVVDHINHDPLDNRKANLRNCTHQQNILNSNPKRGGTSVYRGVHRYRESWVAHIHLNDTTYYLGTFKEEVEAARAYDKASKELHKQFGRLNFPDE